MSADVDISLAYGDLMIQIHNKNAAGCIYRVIGWSAKGIASVFLTNLSGLAGTIHAKRYDTCHQIQTKQIEKQISPRIYIYIIRNARFRIVVRAVTIKYTQIKAGMLQHPWSFT